MDRKNAFTLIELMIVVAIVVIVAVVAVPNILQTAKSDNQQKAINYLEKYHEAQGFFRMQAIKKKSDDPNTGLYARPFGELYKYGDTAVDLMGLEFAEAVDAHHGLNGYYFADDPRVPPQSESAFGLFAIPCLYGKTGDFVYYIDQNGAVLEKDPGAQVNTPNSYFTGANHPRDAHATGWYQAN